MPSRKSAAGTQSDEVARLMTDSKRKRYETMFLWGWSNLYGAEPQPIWDKVKPVPGRQWRSDFAWPSEKVIVEIEGGTGGAGKIRGRHVRPEGYDEDCRKYNACQEEGWIVLRFSGNMLEADLMGALEQTARILASRRLFAVTGVTR